jgi:hypothetical protein
MKQKNKYISSSIITLVTVLWSNIIWAAPPPNPTMSDDFFNTAGGTGALGINTSNSSYSNTAFGYFALNANTGGNRNTAFGDTALGSNLTGSGNTAIGLWSMLQNTSGYYNTANGAGTLAYNTSGSSNTTNGGWSLFNNTTGRNNTASGFEALYSNTVGVFNTSIGYHSLFTDVAGNSNTVLGAQALLNTKSGSSNLALGVNAGLNLISGDRNIYISNPGLASESATIRIGNSGHTKTFITGIRGQHLSLTNAVPVVINSKGQLGVIYSSARFKKNIQDMNDASRKLLQLRPVTYHYKQADESGENPLEYGLIAEEVAKVYPDLVAYGADGKIETVQYQKLTPMILNELQHTNALLETEKLKGKTQEDLLKTEQLKNQQQAQEIDNLKGQMTVLQTQAQRIEVLTSWLSRIEAQQSIGMLENNGQKLVHN